MMQRAALLACLAALGSVPGAYFTGFRIVDSESVPMGVYSTRPAERSALVVGAYVCLPATGESAPRALRAAVASGLVPQAWKHEPLLKRIAAVGGDVVTYVEGQGLRVNGKPQTNSLPLPADSYGNALPRPTWPVTLDNDEVWLTSEHARGFDSRYFGPVNTTALTCVGEPVWTF